MKKILLATLIAMQFLGPQAFAYDKDVHFHLAYYLARAVGFSKDEAVTLASSQEYVDENPRTAPILDLLPLGQEQRRLFHFPKHDYLAAPQTSRNSFFGLYNVNKGLLDAQSSDPAVKARSWERFGGAMHVLADTYSHESWGYVIGHATVLHNPDRPYYDDSSIAKAHEWAALEYAWLIKFYEAQYGHKAAPVPLPTVQEFIDPLIRKVYHYWSWDYDNQIEKRSRNWQRTIAAGGYDDVAHDQAAYERTHLTNFMAGYGRFCIPHEQPAVQIASSIAQPANMSVYQEQIVPFDEYCEVAEARYAVTASLPSFITFLLQSNAHLAAAECVQNMLASREALDLLLARADSAEAPLLAIDYLFEKSSAAPDMKRAALIARLAVKSRFARLYAANRLFSAERNQDALRVLNQLAASAASDAERLETLTWIPQDADFLRLWMNTAARGTKAEQNLAIQALFNSRNPAALRFLQRQGKRELLAGRSRPATQRFLVLAFAKQGGRSVANKENLRVLRTLAQKLQQPGLAAPALIALTTYYRGGSQKTKAAVVRSMLKGLDAIDPEIQWEAAYGLATISGEDFTLDPLNPAGIKGAAQTWFDQTFGR